MHVSGIHANDIQMNESDNELDVSIDSLESDVEETKQSENNKVLRKNGLKKRRPSDSKAINYLQKEIDTKQLLRKTADKTTDTQLNKLQEKIQTNFKNQLQEQLKFQQKTNTAQATKDLVSLTKNKHILSDEPITTLEKNEALQQQTLKQRTKQKKTTQILQQNKLHALMQRPDLQTPIKEFVLASSNQLLKQSPEKKAKLEKARANLQHQGMSMRHINTIEQGTRKIVHNDLKKMLKKNFINVAMSLQNNMTPELFDNYSKYYSMLDVAQKANVFDAHPKELKKLKDSAKEEVKDFLIQELDRSIVETKLQTNSVKTLMKVFDQFNSLAGFVKFNPHEYMKTFQKKLENEGLEPFKSPNILGPLDDQSRPANQDQQQNQQQSDPDTQENDENQLRNAYIKTHLSHKLIDKAKTHWNAFLLEKKCDALNLNTEKIKKEAEKIAILRLRMEVRQIFEHRAVLPHLDCEEYKHIMSQLRHVLKALKKCGSPMTKKEVKAIQDQSNRSLFTYIKEEYIKCEVFLEQFPKNKTLHAQKNRYLNVLNRLKAETSIHESIKPSLMQDLHFLSDVNIIEAA